MAPLARRTAVIVGGDAVAGSYLRGTGRDTEADLDLTGLVRRFIFDDHLVDDIVQETFVRAYGARLHLECLDATNDVMDALPVS